MKVFVYGSLLSGLSNHPVLGDAPCLGEGRTKPEFTMLSLGGFPGIIEGGETAVVGEIYEANEAVERRLDSLEGVNHEFPEQGLYRRAFIELEDGEEVLVYIYNHGRYEMRGRVEVPDGDWRNFNSRKEQLFSG